GALVAEVGKGAFLVDTATHAKVADTRALVLRGPEVDDTGPRAVGPLSTELQAIVDAAGKDGSLADAEHQLRARLGLPETDAGTTGAASIDLLAGPRAGRSRRRRWCRHRTRA